MAIITRSGVQSPTTRGTRSRNDAARPVGPNRAEKGGHKHFMLGNLQQPTPRADTVSAVSLDSGDLLEDLNISETGCAPPRR